MPILQIMTTGNFDTYFHAELEYGFHFLNAKSVELAKPFLCWRIWNQFVFWKLSASQINTFRYFFHKNLVSRGLRYLDCSMFWGNRIHSERIVSRFTDDKRAILSEQYKPSSELGRAPLSYCQCPACVSRWLGSGLCVCGAVPCTSLAPPPGFRPF
jgi:hypothetical protein